MHLEFTSHCWKYNRLLMYQLSGFLLNPPRPGNFLTVSICACPSDLPVVKVLETFRAFPWPNNVELKTVWMDQPHLCARAIGRNKVALATKAHWVWFSDCDYAVGPTGIDDICRIIAQQPGPLWFPHEIRACEKDVGARLVEEATGEPRILKINDADFVPHFFKVAIGGVQFVPGDVARRGFLPNDKKEQTPHPGGWKPDHEDKKYRATLGTGFSPSGCVRELYRIRHADRGAPGHDVLL